ncbi:Translation initiation factor IF-2-chloroplastic [Striga hermonthica]|uniref:Translation initiation factor IF-2, chloroplastic n=1 Tax=Striga hermonthica TaxID=68872 RepID=A0A9N7MIY5_STRHE|nr:Translation initiation factor IF-2-chloroplastic [Striga hermonthica]
MASLASLANLGSVNTNSLSNFDGSVCLVRSISFRRNGTSFRSQRWRYVGMCRCSVTTDFIPEQGTSVSLDSTNNGGSENTGPDSFLKAAPKPVLRSAPQLDPVLSPPLDESRRNRESSRDKTNGMDENRSKVIESLGEVLEKAEKLETNKNSKFSVQKSLNGDNGKPPSPAINLNNMPKTRSVWRKGNPVTTAPNIVKEPFRPAMTGQKIVKEPFKPVTSVQKTVKEQETEVDGGRLVGSQAVVNPLKPPQPPQKIQPKLQIRPSVAPSPPTSVRKPVILKDVNAAAKPNVADRADPVTEPAERKPILIDKFASKKPVVDPLIAQAVSAPPKLSRSPALGKFKNEFRKKSGPSGGPRRRMVKGNDDNPDDDSSEHDASIPGMARKGRKWSKASRKAARLQAARDAAPVKVEIMEVDEDGMFTEELAFNLATSEGEILGYLYSKGIRPVGVQKLSNEMVKIVCREYGVEVIDAAPVRVEEMAKKKEIFDEDDLDKLQDRSPVLTIMGHVDHGKTTLLDYIRKSKVAASEAGGITQGIGAYKVQIPVDGKPQTCVFLDTPGHEAFGAMRARGARVTDIAVIVVAADDGIRPQTSEAIAHAKAAGVPIIVAINKIDKDGANPDKVLQDLSSVGLMPEDWGGDIPMVKISALKGENVDELLETIMLVAEVVIGLNNVPLAGDEFEIVDSLDIAREKAESRAEYLRNERITAKAGDGMVTLSALASAMSAGKNSGLDLHQLNMILKVDVQGSIEAVRQALQVLPQDNITLKFLLQATGDVSISDVDLAVASKAIIFGFNVRTAGSVKSYADNKGVEIRLYKVIYELIDDVRNAMEGLLDSVEEQIPIGAAEVRAVFSSGSGRVAGCMVTEGKIVKDCGIRVLRKRKEVHVGVLSSLRRVKEIVKEVNAGLECGIGLEEFDDWEEGDSIVAFNTVQKRRTLEEASASMSAALEKVRMRL